MTIAAPPSASARECEVARYLARDDPKSAQALCRNRNEEFPRFARRRPPYESPVAQWRHDAHCLHGLRSRLVAAGISAAELE
jgi:hypothetical protein